MAHVSKGCASISTLVPNPDDLLALEVEETAGVLLEHLNSCNPNEPDPHAGWQLHRHNFFHNLTPYSIVRDADKNLRVQLALMEAWAWLEREGFIAVQAGRSDAEAFFITRRGRRAASRAGLDACRKANLLPKAQLHPLIADKVYAAFLRGDYDTAVFQAFREVEVTVRQAGPFPADSLGVALMREAFRPGKENNPPGRLTDTQLPSAEREAMANLFAGAIGLYKNPQSHRHVPTHAEEAAEVIVFASHLLRIVDRLKPQQTTGAQP